jgi:Tfp pilus assembly protein FimV
MTSAPTSAPSNGSASSSNRHSGSPRRRHPPPPPRRPAVADDVQAVPMGPAFGSVRPGQGEHRAASSFAGLDRVTVWFCVG